MPPPLRVVVLARQAVSAAGLREIVREAGMEPVEAGEAAPDDTPVLAADVALADLPAGDEGRELLDRVAATGLPAVLLVDRLSADAGERTGEPRGWLGRDARGEAIAAALRAVASGLTVADPRLEREPQAWPDGGRDGSAAEGLTEREGEVLGLVALGLPNKAIALRLGISEHTVKFHVAAVLSKLGARSRAEAVATAARRGLLRL